METLKLPHNFNELCKEKKYDVALNDARPAVQEYLEYRGMPKGRTPRETAQIAVDNFSGEMAIGNEIAGLAKALLGGLFGDSDSPSQAELEAQRRARERERQNEFLKIAALAVAGAIVVYLIAKKA